jgi:hypothetical protein
MSPTISTRLNDTVVARWHDRLAGRAAPRRNHWKTKEVYFRSVAKLISTWPDEPLTWRSVVAGAMPRGRRSTFYEVAGPHARHRMIDDLIREGGLDAMQLALQYRRSAVVDQLVDETKVWSYWPYRQRFLAGLPASTTAEAMTTRLAQSLLAWASGHTHMAAALDHSPPACAVEDMVVIADSRLTAVRAATRLRDLMQRGAAECSQ